MEARIIKTSADYKIAMEEVDKLIALDPEPGTEQAERLDLLSLLIEKYESERFFIDRPTPLEAIKFRMEEQGLKQKDLIPFVGSKSKVSEILAGKRTLTIPMIRALNSGLGIPADVLLQDPDQRVNCFESISWDRFPLKEMLKRGWLRAMNQELQSDSQILLNRFFADLGRINGLPLLCRRTIIERSGKSMDKYALWAWTARILMKAESVNLPEYKRDNVNREFIEHVVHLSLSDSGPIEAQKCLATYGIPLIIEPHLPRTHLDGAALLTSEGRPIIGLTIRHDRIDNFWFNLIHELVHVWKHLKTSEEVFLDNLDSEPGSDPREKDADRTVSELFIPRTIWKRSDAYRQRTQDAILELALQLRIHPAIVAGRIRYDTGNFRILNHMIGAGKVRKLFPDIVWY